MYLAKRKQGCKTIYYTALRIERANKREELLIKKIGDSDSLSEEDLAEIQQRLKDKQLDRPLFFKQYNYRHLLVSNILCDFF